MRGESTRAGGPEANGTGWTLPIYLLLVGKLARRGAGIGQDKVWAREDRWKSSTSTEYYLGTYLPRYLTPCWSLSRGCGDGGTGRETEREGQEQIGELEEGAVGVCWVVWAVWGRMEMRRAAARIRISLAAGEARASEAVSSSGKKTTAKLSQGRRRPDVCVCVCVCVRVVGGG